MITDKNMMFCEDQALSVSATSVISENVIDLGAAGLDIGAGTPIYFNAIITTLSTSDSNTLIIELQDGATDAAGDDLLEFASFIPHTTGLKIKCPLPSDVARYVSMYMTASATLTAGKITAFLSLD